MHLRKYRPPYALWKHVIKKEMHKSEDPDMAAGTLIDRDLCSDTPLHRFAHPGNARVHKTCCLSLAVQVQAGLQGELNNEDHAVQWSAEPDVLHKGLKILETVLDRKGPCQGGGDPLYFPLGFSCFLICHIRGDRTLSRDVRADDTGECQRSEEFQRVRQVAEPLAEEQRRG